MPETVSSEQPKRLSRRLIMQRPDWDHYFMEIATVVAKRSTCLRRQVGALLGGGTSGAE